MTSLSIYNLHHEHSQIDSSLRSPLRHPAKPVQRTRRGDVEADVNPQEPKISPLVGKANTGRFQERRRRADRTVLANTCG